MSDIKDLGDEKPVLDGTEWIPGQQTNGTTFHTPASALGGVGPFTDGDGNVYSPFFDSVGQRSGQRCTATNGDITEYRVGPSTARLYAEQHDNGLIAYVEVGVDGSIDIESDGSVTINGVVIDPASPWPGG